MRYTISFSGTMTFDVLVMNMLQGILDYEKFPAMQWNGPGQTYLTHISPLPIFILILFFV